MGITSVIIMKWQRKTESLLGSLLELPPKGEAFICLPVSPCRVGDIGFAHREKQRQQLLPWRASTRDVSRLPH